MATRQHVVTAEPGWPPEWPGQAWPGYFTRMKLHRVEPVNAQRLAYTLGLAECGAVAVRPRNGADYSWCVPCRACFPEPGWPTAPCSNR